MRARLIHNPAAGGADHSADALIAALETAGFEVLHSPGFARERDAEWPAETVDLIVAAGGDGTIGRTVRALGQRAARTEPGMHAAVATPALAIAPLGTANNIARSLGLEGDAASLLAGLAEPVRRRLDVGIAQGAWGTCPFVEGVGVGLFQHVLEHEASSKDKAPNRARSILLSELESGHPARTWKVSIDGVTMTDDLLLLETMIMPSVGPRLRFAPEADPFDGLFDVVLARACDRERLARYLRALLDGDEGATGDFETVRARHVHLELCGASVRIDDHVLPGTGGFVQGADLADRGDFWMLPGAIELWLPGPR